MPSWEIGVGGGGGCTNPSVSFDESTIMTGDECTMVGLHLLSSPEVSFDESTIMTGDVFDSGGPSSCAKGLSSPEVSFDESTFMTGGGGGGGCCCREVSNGDNRYCCGIRPGEVGGGDGGDNRYRCGIRAGGIAGGGVGDKRYGCGIRAGEIATGAVGKYRCRAACWRSSCSFLIFLSVHSLFIIAAQ